MVVGQHLIVSYEDKVDELKSYDGGLSAFNIQLHKVTYMMYCSRLLQAMGVINPLSYHII